MRIEKKFMNFRNGVDLVEIERFEQIDQKILKRFINRVFTSNEQEICRDRMASYAGRFAAKEAVAKTLGTGIGEIKWKDIEILKGSQGEPLLILHGNALEKSNELGLSNWSLSISHGKQIAIAFVIASGT
jgi:holo-[acyl-carrier protein] synthase